MKEYNYFIDANIDTVFYDIEGMKENIAYFFVKGDNERAAKYKEALKELYQEIGELVLENKEVTQKIQALLRGEETQEVKYERPNVWVLCENLYNGNKEWYFWSCSAAVKEGDIIETYEADLPGRAKVLKVMYSAEPAGDIGPDMSTDHYDNPAQPGQKKEKEDETTGPYFDLHLATSVAGIVDDSGFDHYAYAKKQTGKAVLELASENTEAFRDIINILARANLLPAEQIGEAVFKLIPNHSDAFNDIATIFKHAKPLAEAKVIEANVIEEDEVFPF